MPITLPPGVDEWVGTAVTVSTIDDKNREGFSNPDAPNVAVDPTNVYLRWQTPDGVVTTWQYGVGPSEIVKVGTGVYTAELATVGSSPGEWVYQWIGTGVCAAVNAGSFVTANPPL